MLAGFYFRIGARHERLLTEATASFCKILSNHGRFRPRCCGTSFPLPGSARFLAWRQAGLLLVQQALFAKDDAAWRSLKSL
jgi:hypothetical protein